MIAEERLTLVTDDGVRLDARLGGSAEAAAGLVLCHPHPLYGGDMDNAVVACLAAVGARQGFATLRFDFRGVGGSTGTWDEGRGEQRDVRAAVDGLRARLGAEAPIALAGYSFGASVAAAAVADGLRVDALALVAPPLGADAALPPLPPRTLVVAGSADPYCPRAAIERLRSAGAGVTVEVLDGVDHFFADGLPRLERAVERWLGELRTGQPGGRGGAG